jgi:hypothetical protein
VQRSAVPFANDTNDPRARNASTGRDTAGDADSGLLLKEQAAASIAR